jgi:hypothetical protein
MIPPLEDVVAKRPDYDYDDEEQDEENRRLLYYQTF